MLYSYCFSLTKTVFNTAAVTLTHFSYVLSQRTHDFSQVWFFIMNKKWLNGSVELSPCLCCNVSAVLWVCVSVTGTENKIKYHIHSQPLITTSPKSNERVDFVTPFFFIKNQPFQNNTFLQQTYLYFPQVVPILHCTPTLSISVRLNCYLLSGRLTRNFPEIQLFA